VRRGDFRGCSFAYTCDEDTGVHYEKNDKDSRALIRYVDEVNGLYDVSVVIHPAYPQTNVDSRSAVLDGALMRGMIERQEENDDTNSNSNSDSMDENKNNPQEPQVDNTVEELKKEMEGMRRSITDLQAGQEAVNKKVSSIKVREEKKRNFSLLRAIREVANGEKMSADIEAITRAGREEMRSAGLSTVGQIVVPQLRADVTVTAEHDDTIGIDVYNTFAPIREGLVAVKAGATFYPGLVGNDLLIPVLGGGNVAWATEVGQAADPSYAFSSVKLSPHRLTAQFKLSKQMVVQDSADIEATLLADIRKAVITKLNATMFGVAAASGGAPKGIGNGQTAAVATDWAKLTGVEAAVERLAVGEKFAYIASPEASAAIRAMTYNKTSRLIYEAGNVDGTPMYKSIGVGVNQGYYGDWSNLVIGQWGALDLTVDPYTAAGTGELVITINSYFDYDVARAGSLKLFTTVAAGS
jgi:HK97 family phage major capsid protein